MIIPQRRAPHSERPCALRCGRNVRSSGRHCGLGTDEGKRGKQHGRLRSKRVVCCDGVIRLPVVVLIATYCCQQPNGTKDTWSIRLRFRRLWCRNGRCYGVPTDFYPACWLLSGARHTAQARGVAAPIDERLKTQHERRVRHAGAVSSVGRASRLHREGFVGSSPTPPTIFKHLALCTPRPYVYGRTSELRRSPRVLHE